MIVWVTLIPIVFFLVFGEPVALLKLSGAIEAAHIPIVTGLTLYLNRRAVPKPLRASTMTEYVTAAAGVFFAAFAAFYLLQAVSGD